ncbi:replication protein C, IncQ-type [Modicisalibacter sp. MOD 31.J]|uniref:replication protein C, IncQ-type n=1 Tax=Modicisalibacter sp. MOD 31.J TaxID=2831897 RepID=UPI001CCF9FD1|nr:replication protein C, IncQ-type [Modicisalibacter sp. MOD 31.J]MBZ9574513.1 RepB family plasmid replication initiator protein [Modicisalibacter sp. MOD 31.J]
MDQSNVIPLFDDLPIPEPQSSASPPSSGGPSGDPAPPHRLTHARYEPAHCLAPGLFRALKRGERKLKKLDVTYEFGKDQQITFKGPEPLGADDLRLLQVLVAMTGPAGKALPPEPETEPEQRLRALLKVQGSSMHEDVTAVETSYRQLAHEMGYTSWGGEQGKVIKAGLIRLSTVTIIAESKSRWEAFHILSRLGGDEITGRITFAVNPMITRAVVGSGRYVRIELEEVRRLKSDVARLIHNRLCGWINPGQDREVMLETLCSYAWPEQIASTDAIIKRKQRARKALKELQALGWAVDEIEKGKFRITRPAPLL